MTSIRERELKIKRLQELVRKSTSMLSEQLEDTDREMLKILHKQKRRTMM